ncbi:hypothetical protein BC829DRAFT_55430 [Chytridium lagenaria]|nr:hypothetical protein BC829DRAFT_55430 [Chytridium lagenaria]
MDTSKEFKRPLKGMCLRKTTRVNPADKSDEKSKVWISKEAKGSNQKACLHQRKQRRACLHQIRKSPRLPMTRIKAKEKTKSESLNEKVKGLWRNFGKGQPPIMQGRGETKLKKGGDFLLEIFCRKTLLIPLKLTRIRLRGWRKGQGGQSGGSSTSRTPRDPPSSAVKKASLEAPPSSAAKSDGRGSI